MSNIPPISTSLAMTDTTDPPEQSPPVPFQQPSSSQFQNAQVDSIHGGQFITESRSSCFVTNYIVQHYPSGPAPYQPYDDAVPTRYILPASPMPSSPLPTSVANVESEEVEGHVKNDMRYSQLSSTVQPSPSFVPSDAFSLVPPGHAECSMGEKINVLFPAPISPRYQHEKLPDITDARVSDPWKQTPPPIKIRPLGDPSLVPFVKDKGDKEKLGLRKNIDSRIPLYMFSNIIDRDTIALWFPTPTLYPPGGGRRGIQLGDLGYFDEEGEFRPIFNIFHSYNQNIAEGARPPNQPYQHLHLDKNWVQQVDIQKQQTYMTPNIEKQDAGPHPQQLYQFRTYKNTWRSGVIIVLPHGRTSSCIATAYFSLPEVKRHLREYAPSWYEHARRYLPMMPNGFLVLVQATHSARSWGIAAFTSKRKIKEPLTATFKTNPTNEYQHMWQTNNSEWKTNLGPSSIELMELGGRDPPPNQCIGIVVSSLRLDEATWRLNFASPPSISGDGTQGNFLGHRLSRDSVSDILVHENSGGHAGSIRRDSLDNSSPSSGGSQGRKRRKKNKKRNQTADLARAQTGLASDEPIVESPLHGVGEPSSATLSESPNGLALTFGTLTFGHSPLPSTIHPHTESFTLDSELYIGTIPLQRARW